jgi:hypothetical protein
MKRVSSYLLVAAVTVAAAALAVVALLSPAVIPETQAAPGATGKDVIMIRCSAGPAFAVKAYERSTAAPAKNTENCPQAIAILLQNGFTIRDTGYSDDAENMVITLVR